MRLLFYKCMAAFTVLTALGGAFAQTPVEPPAATVPDTAPELGVATFAGGGVGTRDLEWPQEGERRTVETGAFAAVEVGARFTVAWTDTFSLGAELAYQTSVGLTLTEHHVAGTAEDIDVRAHRFEGLLSPVLRFGERNDWYLAPALGIGFRNLRPTPQRLTPGYSLLGPLARVTLRVPLSSRLALRLSPEAQWWWLDGQLGEINEYSTGIGFGGEAALEVRLFHRIAVEATFRQAHALLHSPSGADATDVERFATARIVGEL